jgi:hypothetical protein
MTAAPALDLPPGTFEPHPKQQLVWDALEATPDGSLALIGFGGAAGPGKSRALVEIAIDFALDYPGTRILIGRKDFKDLRTTTMEEFYRHCPPGMLQRSHGSEHWCDVGVSKGSTARIFFDELKDYLSQGSEQYGLVCVDEAGEVPETTMLMLLTRMREPHAAKRAIICASNPWPGWFKRWFVDRELPEDALAAVGGRVTFIPARMEDNPSLPPNYEATLRAVLPADWVQRFVEGRWDAFVGQVYPEFGPVHRWRGELPPFTAVYGGLDFGGQNPWAHKTAGIAAGLTPQGALVRFAEFEEAGADVYEQLVSWMAACERLVRTKIKWRADRTQMWGIDQLRRAERKWEINDSHGGADSVQMGIGTVRRRLEAAVQGLPWGSYYTDDLVKFPRRMETYRWPEPANDDERVQSNPIKRDDDLMDADRYMHEEADGFGLEPLPRSLGTLRR